MVFMVNKIDYHRALIPCTIFAIVSIIFCLPILIDITNWRHMDWDEVFFWGGFEHRPVGTVYKLPPINSH